ncbi:hypothetical protein [Alcanivorax sp.]|uniref:hypothetical protein n=1 Tax=Alcanivorax sp. TaxID=1872427 RepID=UPI0025BE311C|nr:hypothetical protein [Alcanivorax sp.]
MTQILWIGVCVVAVGLLGTGLYFHARRRTLGSDPILIGSCYLSGAGLLAGNMIIPLF